MQEIEAPKASLKCAAIERIKVERVKQVTSGIGDESTFVLRNDRPFPFLGEGGESTYS